MISSKSLDRTYPWHLTVSSAEKQNPTISKYHAFNFPASPSVPKFHIYMVTVLANLNVGCDDSGPDEPLSLKATIRSPYWKDFEKTMHWEFQSLIENDTWEYRDVSTGRAVLTGR